MANKVSHEFQVPDPTPDDRLLESCNNILNFSCKWDGEELTDQLYDILIEQIRFRQKCHNQGFDNMVELIEMHRKSAHQAAASREPIREMESEPPHEH